MLVVMSELELYQPLLFQSSLSIKKKKEKCFPSSFLTVWGDGANFMASKSLFLFLFFSHFPPHISVDGAKV